MAGFESDRPEGYDEKKHRYPYIHPEALRHPEPLAIDADTVEDFIEHFDHHDRHVKTHPRHRAEDDSAKNSTQKDSAQKDRGGTQPEATEDPSPAKKRPKGTPITRVPSGLFGPPVYSVSAFGTLSSLRLHAGAGVDADRLTVDVAVAQQFDCE